MGTTDVGAVAEAVAAICNLIYSELHPDQRTLIERAFNEEQVFMEEFTRAVLGCDAPYCNLLIDGLSNVGPLPRLTSGQREQLQRTVPNIDGSTLVNLFVRARQGVFAARVGQIVATTKPQ